MSVVGIDFGNSNNVVALARRKGIDVVLNTESKRETPCMVNFGEKQVRERLLLRTERAWVKSNRRHIFFFMLFSFFREPSIFITFFPAASRDTARCALSHSHGSGARPLRDASVAMISSS